MAIKAGDVVMDFVADLSKLDEGLDQAEGKVEQWQEKVKGLNEQQSDSYSKMWAPVATAAEEAGTKVAEVATTSAAAATQAAAATAKAATAATAGAGEAAAAVTGIGAAAEVTGELIGAAFGAGVVTLLIGALLVGVEQFQKLDERARLLAEAWGKVDEAQKKVFDGLANELLKAQIETAKLSDNNLEALRLKLQLIDNISLGQLEDQIKRIAAEAEKALKGLDQGLIQKVFFGDTTGEVAAEFQRISKNVEEALNPRTPQAFQQALGLLESELGTVQKRINEMSTAKPVQVGGFIAPSVDPSALKAWDELHFRIQEYQKDIREAQAVEKQQKLNVGLEEQKKEIADASKAAKEYAQQLITDAKAVENAQLTQIQTTQAQEQKQFADGKLDAAQWAAAQIKAANDARNAHEQFLDRVAAIYKQTGQSAKGLEAEQASTTQKIKDYAKSVDDTAKATEGLRKEELAFGKLSSESWKESTKEINAAKFAQDLLAKSNVIPQWVKDSATLTLALKQVGIQGLQPLQQNLANAARAEKLLNDSGVKDGRVWLQVQQAKLRAIIALDQAEGKSARAEIKALQDVEKELKRMGVQSEHTRKDLHDMMQVMQSDANSFAQAIGDAFAAALTGQESIGQAMIEASAKMVGQLASQWAEFFAGMAIADLFWHPAKAVAELAASIALYTLAGVMGAVGHGGGGTGGGSGSGTQTTGGTSTPNAATQPAQNPVVVQNTARLATGGLVTRSTAIVAGDGMTGGDAMEGVIPLTNPRAMREIAGAIAAHMPHGGGDHYHIKGDVIDHAQFSKKISRQVKRGKARLTSANSLRVTRRS